MSHLRGSLKVTESRRFGMRGANCNRRPPRDHRAAALESCPHCRGKCRPLEFKVARHEPKVEIILHSAVCHSELHHGLELLGDHGLPRIDADARALLAENRRKFSDGRRGCNCISKSHIDLQAQDGGCQSRGQQYPKAAVFLCITNLGNLDARRIED